MGGEEGVEEERKIKELTKLDKVRCGYNFLGDIVFWVFVKG